MALMGLPAHTSTFRPQICRNTEAQEHKRKSDVQEVRGEGMLEYRDTRVLWWKNTKLAEKVVQAYRGEEYKGAGI